MTLSLEYLLISVVAMAMLTISVAALLNIKDYSDNSIEMFKFRSSANKMINTIDSVCALGSGNRRMIELKTELSIDGDYIYNKNHSKAIDSVCDVETEEDLSGRIIIRNEKGKIRIREQ